MTTKFIYKVSFNETKIVPNQHNELFSKTFNVTKIFQNETKAFEYFKEHLYECDDNLISMQILITEE